MLKMLYTTKKLIKNLFIIFSYSLNNYYNDKFR